MLCSLIKYFGCDQHIMIKSDHYVAGHKSVHAAQQKNA